MCEWVRCEHVFVRNGVRGRDLKKSENVGVVQHDSAGFGLTERPRTDLMKFTKVFNAKCLKAMAKKYASDGDSNNYTKKKKKKKKVPVRGTPLGAIAATLTTTLEDGDDDAEAAGVYFDRAGVFS